MKPCLTNHLKNLITPIEGDELKALLPADAPTGYAKTHLLFIHYGSRTVSCDPYGPCEAPDWSPARLRYAAGDPTIVEIVAPFYGERLFRTRDLQALKEALFNYNIELAEWVAAEATARLRAKKPCAKYDLPKEGYASISPPINHWSRITTRDHGDVLVFPFHAPGHLPMVYLELAGELYTTTNEDWLKHLAYGEILPHLTQSTLP